MRSDSSYLISVALTQPTKSNQILKFWTVTKATLGREQHDPGQIQLDNCSITWRRSTTRLMNQAVRSHWAPTRTRARRTRPATFAHSADVTKRFRESCASTHTYTFTMGLNHTSAPSLAVGKPSVRSKIYAFTWGSTSMRGLSSAHKAAERVSGPRETCGTTNVVTLETSKCYFIINLDKVTSSLKVLCELWLIIILDQIRNYHTTVLFDYASNDACL